MSFDLLIETTDSSAHERVSQAIAGHPVELHASASGVSLGFSARTSDAVMREVYAALVSLALSRDYTLFDPQAGVRIDLKKPGHAPPGW